MTDRLDIRILCVDDHPIVLEGLRGVLSLQPDFTVMATPTTGREAIESFRIHRPDIVLLDLRLQDMTGFQVIQAILAIQPDACILILSSLEGDADIERALALGAKGYLVKGATREELTRAIRTVLKGRPYVARTAAASMAEHSSSERLTPREYSVLSLMAKGHRNKEIGAKLVIAEDTVKMGVKDRTEAVTVAIRRGLHHL